MHVRLLAFLSIQKGLHGVQGQVDKVVVVIKDKEQVALERYIFSIETMINIEGYNKDIG